MSSVARSFSGLGSTRAGQSAQVNKAFKGLAAEMKRRKAVQPADCDEPQTIEQYRLLVASLKQQLADAQTLIDDMRAIENSDAPAPAAPGTKYWDSKTMAQKSGVAVCTICRNAESLGGIKLGGDWLFPAGITYGKKRKRKAK